VASETESLWDISIDTVESYRRQGYATAAVVQLMGLMLRRGKVAVWGALQSNSASMKLAQYLGFSEIDEIWVLTRKTT
ncbi:MAG: GNAT family N-acetyltransferase, partial [Pseudohongiella sp.]